VSSRPRPPFTRVGERHSGVTDEEVRETRADAVDRAERTLDVQRERFDRIDQKASKLLRFVAALVGAVFAVLGLGIGSDKTTVSVLGATPSNPLSTATEIALAVAGVSLVGSVFFAAGTFVTTRFRSSFTSDPARSVRDSRYGREAYHVLLLTAYADAIDENRPRVQTNVWQFVVTLCLVVLGVTSLSVAVSLRLLAPIGRVRGAVLGVAFVAYVLFVAWVVEVRVRAT
jgi:hypothetical protein